jgi:hypothetical protein
MGFGPKDKGGWFASHPDIADRITKARSTESRAITDAVFEGFNSEGEIVGTLTLQMQRYYPKRANASAGFEVIGHLESTSALEKKEKIKDIILATNIGRIKLDNKEDVEIEPGDSVGALFLSTSQAQLFERIESIELKLGNAVRWQKAKTEMAVAAEP